MRERRWAGLVFWQSYCSKHSTNGYLWKVVCIRPVKTHGNPRTKRLSLMVLSGLGLRRTTTLVERILGLPHLDKVGR